MPDSSGMVNSFDMSAVDQLDPELASIVRRRAQLLGPAYKLFYRNPVRFVRAEGVYLYDAEGNAYLDAYNNVPAVGHCHPKVVEAIARQAAISTPIPGTPPTRSWTTPNACWRPSRPRSAT